MSKDVSIKRLKTNNKKLRGRIEELETMITNFQAWLITNTK